MRIAVINETSAADKNQDIIQALQQFDHEIINAGMKKSGGEHELTYIETGFIGALLLNIGRADFVVGGCGTGQGFMNSIMQYPNVFCGLIQEPIDAWLFSRINGGNCISLALNKGYGWAGNINLQFIFEKLFSSPIGSGYPEHRKASQQKSRNTLCTISKQVHLDMAKIIEIMDINILKNTFAFPGIWELIDVDSIKDISIKDALNKRYEEISSKKSYKCTNID